MAKEQATGILLISLVSGLRSRAFYDVVKNSHSQRAFLETLVSCRLDLLLTFSYSHVMLLACYVFSPVEHDAAQCMSTVSFYLILAWWVHLCFQAAKQARYDKEAVIKFFRMVCLECSTDTLYSLYVFHLQCCLNAPFSWSKEDIFPMSLLPLVHGPLLQEQTPSYL